MKGVARAHVWWPGVNGDFEQTVHNCEACQSNRKAPPTSPLHPWPWAQTPWERVHIDYAGPLFDYMYLVVVNNHSKWIEVVPMKSTTTVKTLEVLRSLFARYGLPKQLVSDNGPQFTSQEFEECMRVNGIRHIKINGEAERFVQTFKRSLQAGRKENGTVPQKLAIISINSQCNHWGYPSGTLPQKKDSDTIDLLKPSVEDYVHEQQMKQKQYHDNHSCQRSYHVGQAVLVRNH